MMGVDGRPTTSRVFYGRSQRVRASENDEMWMSQAQTHAIGSLDPFLSAISIRLEVRKTFESTERVAEFLNWNKTENSPQRFWHAEEIADRMIVTDSVPGIYTAERTTLTDFVVRAACNGNKTDRTPRRGEIESKLQIIDAFTS